LAIGPTEKASQAVTAKIPITVFECYLANATPSQHLCSYASNTSNTDYGNRKISNFLQPTQKHTLQKLLRIYKVTIIIVNKHSLTFHVHRYAFMSTKPIHRLRYIVIATKPVQRLQICPIVHN